MDTSAVARLHDLMVGMGVVPKYDLISDGRINSPIFKYRVYVNDITAVGSGRSKKEAKNEAARIAYAKLAHQAETAPVPGGLRIIKAPASLRALTAAGASSRHQQTPAEAAMFPQEKISGDVVGALRDMCAKSKLSQPEYELLEEQGPDHEKSYTFLCSVSKLGEKGIAHTKRLAKKQAAYNMMKRLTASPSLVTNGQEEQPPNVQEEGFKRSRRSKEGQEVEVLNEQFKKAIQRYNAKTESREGTCSNAQTLVNGHFSQIPEERKLKAQEILSKIKFPSPDKMKNEGIDWLAHLEHIFHCLKMSKIFVPVSTLKNGDKSIFLKLNLSMEAIFIGQGRDTAEAKQHASYNALIFLNDMLK